MCEGWWRLLHRILMATSGIRTLWLTFKQANQLGGSVRKGEHGEVIVFWKVRSDCR